MSRLDIILGTAATAVFLFASSYVLDALFAWIGRRRWIRRRKVEKKMGEALRKFGMWEVRGDV